MIVYFSKIFYGMLDFHKSQLMLHYMKQHLFLDMNDMTSDHGLIIKYITDNLLSFAMFIKLSNNQLQWWPKNVKRLC